MNHAMTLGVMVVLVFVVVLIADVDAKRKRPNFKSGPWKPARITFYGGPDASGTYEGSCGYGDVTSKEGRGYGVLTAALSTPLYRNAAACGSCYELSCPDVSKGCKPGTPSITITATNLCGDDGDHFDLTQPAFLRIAEFKAGIVPIQYRRVACIREGGIRFTISPKSNPYFLLVLIWNVGGSGEVDRVLIKGDKGKPFTEMTRNYGQYWESHESLVGQSITFRIKASDKRVSTSWHRVPANWQFGQTYEGKNFK